MTHLTLTSVNLFLREPLEPYDSAELDPDSDSDFDPDEIKPQHLRIEYEGAFCHITARGNEGKRIYLTKTD